MRVGVRYASESDLCPRASRAIRYYRKKARGGSTVHSWGREQFSTTKSETLTASDHESLVSSGCFALFCMRVSRTRVGVQDDGGRERRGRRGGSKVEVEERERRREEFRKLDRAQIAVICRHKLPRSDNRLLRARRNESGRRRNRRDSAEISRRFRCC